MNTEARSLSLQKQLQRYSPVTLEAKVLTHITVIYLFQISYKTQLLLTMQLTELSEADQKALGLILKAAKVIDDIFYEQVLLICSLNFLFCL